MLHKFFAVCLCSALFFTNVAVGCRTAVATQESPDAVAWRQAENFLIAGQGEEAYAVFSKLLLKFPGHNALRMGLARAAALTGRLQEAAFIYDALLVKFPTVSALAAERDAVTRLLGGQGSPPQSLFTLNGRLRTGLMYDSNANQGPSSDNMQLGNWRITLDGVKNRETAAAYLGANLNLNKKHNEFSPWSMVGDFNVFIRGNANSKLSDIDSREWQWGRIAGGVRYLQGDNLFDIRLKGEIFDSDFVNNVMSLGPELMYMRALTPTLYLISQLSMDWRVYRSDSDSYASERDGFYGQVGEALRFFWGENNRYSFAVGGNYLWGSPESRQAPYGYRGASIPVFFTYKLSDRLELSPHASYTWEFYADPATALEDRKRSDKRFRSGMDMNYKLTETGDWSLELSYTYTNNDSTSALYTYEQQMVSMGVAWSF